MAKEVYGPPAPPDTSFYAKRAQRARIREMLEAAKITANIPATLAKKGIQAAVEDPAEAAKNVAKATAKTVSVAVAPGLYALQQAGGRLSAAMAGAIDPVLQYYGQKNQPAAADVLSQSVRGATKGLLTMEGPRGISADTSLVETYKHHGFKEPFGKDLPGERERLMALMVLSPKAVRPYLNFRDYMTGPEGAALATDVVGGDRLTEGAQLVGRTAKALGASEAASRVGDVLRKTPGTKQLYGAFSPFGNVERKIKNPLTGEVITENAREGMRQFTREMAGERGLKAAYWQDKVSGGKEAIEDGAQQFGMLPSERSKYLEVIRENSRGGGEVARAYDDYVRQGFITQREANWLTRVDEFLDLSVPAERRMRGLKGAELYEASENAAKKAEEAIGRMERLAEEGRRMLEGTRVKTRHLFDAEPYQAKDVVTRFGLEAGERRRLELDLIKAIRDADYATLNFMRASRHKMTPVKYDRKNLHKMKLRELLGIADEVFDPSLAPTRGDVKVTVRRNQNNWRPEARAFDAQGNLVWRYQTEGEVFDKRQFDEALDRARRSLGQGVQFQVDEDIWWKSDKTRPARPTPISRLQSMGKEIKDRDKYFVNYLPRYPGQAVQEREAMFRAGKKGGISTSVGGRRVSAPTTTQEEAREVIRRKFEEKSLETTEPIQELTEALQTHIQRNASAVSKANFLHKVRENFGVEARDLDEITRLEAAGWLPLGKLKGTTAGMTKENVERFGRSYVPESVFRGIEALDRAIEPKVRTGFAKLAHNLLQNEKTYLTVLNPRFSIRNRMSEVLFSYMRGNTDPTTWLDADKLVAGYYRGRKVPGFDMTGDELIRYLQKEGVLSADVGMSAEMMTKAKGLRDPLRDRFRGGLMNAKGMIARQEGALPDQIQPIRGGGSFRKELMESAVEKLNTPARIMSQLNQGGEQRARVAHWLWAMRNKKMDRVAARKEVATTMFDYSADFYTVQEAQLKEWIPFYSWFRRVTPLALRMTFERPGEFAKAGAIMNQVNTMNGVAPEEMEYLGRAYFNSMGIVLPDEKDQLPGTKRVLNVPFGLSDPTQFTQLSPEMGPDSPGGPTTAALRAVGGALRPSIQLPFSFLAAQSVSGEKFTGETVKLPTVLLAVPDDVKDRMGITVIDGLPYGPSTLIPLVRYLQGGVGEAAGGLMSENPRAKGRLASWLSGLSIDPEVPFEGNMRAEAFRAKKHVDDEVKKIYQTIYRMNEAMSREQLRTPADSTR